MRMTHPGIGRKIRRAAFSLLALSAAAAARADEAGMAYFGVNSHIHRHASYEAEVDEMIAAGVKWVRLTPDWGSIEPSSGVYNEAFLARLDGIVNRLTSNNVQILWILCYTPQWASSQSTQPWITASRHAPSDWRLWERYVRFISTRYKGKITHWEVWNEPDLAGFWRGTVGEYKTMLEKAAAQLRAVDPANKVVLAGLALKDGENVDFYEQLLAAGAAPHFDIVAYHAYGNAARMFRIYEYMRRISQQYGIGHRKVWITETGYTTLGDPAREAAKADMVNQIYSIHTQFPDVERLFLFVYRNPVVLNADGSHNLSEENYGIARESDRAPLKALYAYQAVGGAHADFRLQKTYPAIVQTHRVLTWTGGGLDAAPDGSIRRVPAGGRMSFRLHDEWVREANGGLDDRFQVDVTYWDAGTAEWGLEYDARTDPRRPLAARRGRTNAWAVKTFLLDDAWFGNRQDAGADFALTAGGAELLVKEVVVRRALNPGRVVLGSTPSLHKLIEWVVDSTPTHEAYNPVASFGGRECRQVTANNNFIYIKVSDGLVRGAGTPVTVRVRYWDDAPGRLTLQYKSVAGAEKQAILTKAGTGAWQTASVLLEDADFSNGMNYNADFRITNGLDGTSECVDQVEVSVDRPSLSLAPAGVSSQPASPTLRTAYVYPNPARGRNPVLRAFMGSVDAVDVTIFDASGRVVHTARVEIAGLLNGEPVFEYEWTGPKSPGVYHAVFQGSRGGETAIARARFAVIR